VDLWAFGVLIYELVVAETPFSGVNEKEVFAAILKAEILFPYNIPVSARDLIFKVAAILSFIIRSYLSETHRED